MTNWHKNKLKGNIAESVVEFLINSMNDWSCIKFGVEDTIKDLKDMVNSNSTPIAIKIRRMPDFVAFNKKTSEILLIEVKYRKRAEKYAFNFLENYTEHWAGTKMILVIPEEPYFLYVDLETLNFSLREMRKQGEKSKAYWDLNNVGQSIKRLFPELCDEVLEEAKDMIPKGSDYNSNI